MFTKECQYSHLSLSTGRYGNMDHINVDEICQTHRNKKNYLLEGDVTGIFRF